MEKLFRSTRFAALPVNGLDSATRSLAIEHARNRIRVSASSPGHIATPLHAGDGRDGSARLGGRHRRGVRYLDAATFVSAEIRPSMVTKVQATDVADGYSPINERLTGNASLRKGFAHHKPLIN